MTGPGAYLGPAEIRDLAALLDLSPTKKLGQNFVVDANTVRKIVSVAGVLPGETVLEVGPGLGSLTLGLLSAGASVVAVEIDRRLADQLPATVLALLPDAELRVVHADAMAVVELPSVPRRLVANLPYNISVPVLLHLLEYFPSLQSGLVMVQAEVGQRIAASPGSRVYGGPSVKAAWYGQWRTAGQVSRQVFWPVPNVDSILVGFERRATPFGSEQERKATFALVDAAFGQRRKMLRQSLAGVLGAGAASVLERAGIASTRRAEELSVDDFLAIARVD
ncbi:16S rRNA (adenine1518-N6/adenine1519-N6)-dimethyltransferase [Cryobacterium mesophilum]|uniref:Ribosomal RNA small subunit methyltransferase A n=1 Tax=Terrimesophilobacter mesophilus TaxID=433647 RepID=A0A4R8VDZ0_9MICO|nr:16S rRNA (adenine(1518)-N(6)/adenine(1519)-N(6))-dimethyltransferase RsmA [Terrimesophilobacter mesophilus]MBB5633691.1 16S rRNA (adenine1518-N6/adenine1519-N6)-dimethyltransferase [Terrimesophilobacter mesophilus]TFB80380.1 16S rRNA (adenine(1518)-N(6)/adenine(1519)-N(6))-dimethyltransferase RsmA [Terrimesophilobacter mesophilus]